MEAMEESDVPGVTPLPSHPAAAGAAAAPAPAAPSS